MVDRIYRAHKNSDESFCLDGMCALTIMQIYELLETKYSGNKRECDFGASPLPHQL